MSKIIVLVGCGAVGSIAVRTAAFGCVFMNRGKIKEKGVLPPEGCVDAVGFLSIIKDYYNVKEVGGAGIPILIESID